MSEMTLLYCDTLAPNTTPVSVHEIRFNKPVHIHSFRIVCDGERPHPEIPFQGRTPNASLKIELFGCHHGKAKLCAALLDEPHRRQNLNSPSPTCKLSEKATAMPINYLVVRTVPMALSLCLYGVEADEGPAPEPPHWERLPAFGCAPAIRRATFSFFSARAR